MNMVKRSCSVGCGHITHYPPLAYPPLASFGPAGSVLGRGHQRFWPVIRLTAPAHAPIDPGFGEGPVPTVAIGLGVGFLALAAAVFARAAGLGGGLADGP